MFLGHGAFRRKEPQHATWSSCPQTPFSFAVLVSGALVHWVNNSSSFRRSHHSAVCCFSSVRVRRVPGEGSTASHHFRDIFLHLSEKLLCPAPLAKTTGCWQGGSECVWSSALSVRVLFSWCKSRPTGKIRCDTHSGECKKGCWQGARNSSSCIPN